MALSKIQTPLIDTTTDLGDYEEGSWTPVFSNDQDETFTGTYYYQWGRYIKVGKLVTAWCYLYTTNDISTTSGNGFTTNDDLEIHGWPFNVIGNTNSGATNNSTNWVNNSTMQYPAPIDGLRWDDGTGSVKHAPNGFLRELDNKMRFRVVGNGSGTSNNNILIDWVGTKASVKVTVTYETDA